MDQSHGFKGVPFRPHLIDPYAHCPPCPCQGAPSPCPSPSTSVPFRPGQRVRPCREQESDSCHVALKVTENRSFSAGTPSSIQLPQKSRPLFALSSACPTVHHAVWCSFEGAFKSISVSEFPRSRCWFRWLASFTRTLTAVLSLVPTSSPLIPTFTVVWADLGGENTGFGMKRRPAFQFGFSHLDV